MTTGLFNFSVCLKVFILKSWGEGVYKDHGSWGWDQDFSLYIFLFWFLNHVIVLATENKSQLSTILLNPSQQLYFYSYPHLFRHATTKISCFLSPCFERSSSDHISPVSHLTVKNLDHVITRCWATGTTSNNIPIGQLSHTCPPTLPHPTP